MILFWFHKNNNYICDGQIINKIFNIYFDKMVILEVFKTVYDFISSGKIVHGVVTTLLVAVGYLVYHFFGLTLSCIVIGFSAIIYLLIQLPNRISAGHSKSDKYRRLVNEIVRKEITKCLVGMKSDRIFVTEGHNGTHSAANLSFLYMDITYLETAVINDWINFDYRNISTSLFPCFDWIAANSYFEGSIDELSRIDNKISRVITSNGTNYLVASGLFDAHNNCIGTLVATFAEEPECKLHHAAHIQSTANKLERLLTKQYSIKELEKMR